MEKKLIHLKCYQQYKILWINFNLNIIKKVNKIFNTLLLMFELHIEENLIVKDYNNRYQYLTISFQIRMSCSIKIQSD